MNLPDTAFNMRANSAQREPQLQVRLGYSLESGAGGGFRCKGLIQVQGRCQGLSRFRSWVAAC